MRQSIPVATSPFLPTRKIDVKRNDSKLTGTVLTRGPDKQMTGDLPLHQIVLGTMLKCGDCQLFIIQACQHDN